MLEKDSGRRWEVVVARKAPAPHRHGSHKPARDHSRNPDVLPVKEEDEERSKKHKEVEEHSRPDDLENEENKENDEDDDDDKVDANEVDDRGDAQRA